MVILIINNTIIQSTIDDDKEEKLEINPKSNDVNGDVTILPDKDDDQQQSNIVNQLTCWKLNERGEGGETLLHLAVRYAGEAEDMHTRHAFREIARAMLTVYPKLALDFNVGEKHWGMKWEIKFIFYLFIRQTV